MVPVPASGEPGAIGRKPVMPQSLVLHVGFEMYVTWGDDSKFELVALW